MIGGAILHNVVKKTKLEMRQVKMQGVWTWMEELFYVEGPVRAEAWIMTYTFLKKALLYMIYVIKKKLASVPRM